ncbi:ATP-dependent RNA helicase RhlE [compost metagenome]
MHRIGRTGRAGATGQAVSLVCADEVELLAAIETLIGQTLQRRDELGFVPDHRVPQTAPGGQVIKKPKKPKQPKVPDAGKPGRIHLGGLLDDKPQVKAIRKAPGFVKPAPGKAKKPK